MANRAAFFARFPAGQRRIDQSAAGRRILRDDFDVLVVRKENREIRDVPFPFRGRIEILARIRKRVPRAAARARIRMTDRADSRR